MKTLLAVVQNFCRRQGLPVPSSLLATSDPQVEQMVEFLRETAEDLQARYRWRELTFTENHTLTAAEDQGNIFTIAGSDFERIIPETVWNSTLQEPYDLVTDVREWQAYKVGGVAISPGKLTILGRKLLIHPTPTAGEVLTFMWQSKNWILDNDGTTTKSTIAEATDEPILDDRLFALGLKWRWLEAKGMSYAEALREFETLAMDCAARAGPPRRMNLAGTPSVTRPGISVPPGSWSL